MPWAFSNGFLEVVCLSGFFSVFGGCFFLKNRNTEELTCLASQDETKELTHCKKRQVNLWLLTDGQV